MTLQASGERISSPPVLLAVEHLAKSFGTHRLLPFLPAPAPLPVLRDVSFELRRGEIVALRGPSGSGKTTLLKTVAGLITPDAGTVDLPVGRAAVGFSSGEERSLFWRLSALQNLTFFGALHGLSGGEAKRRGLELLAALGLSDKAEEQVRFLSSGQKQRLLAARALMGEPAVILLDEPTGHMDEESVALVWALLEERARRGASVLMATHRNGDEARADAVARLHEGTLQVERSGDPWTQEAGLALSTSRPASPLRRAWAFVRRDLATARSYPVTLLFQLASAVVGCASLFYLSHIVPSGSGYLHPYGGGYFGFAVLGEAAFILQFGALGSFTNTIRDGQLTGTLEALLVAPVSLPGTLFYSSLWTLALSVIQAALFVLVGILLGMPIHALWLLPALAAMAVGFLPTLGLGFLDAAFVLIFKRGAPVNLLVGFVNNLLGGLLYPIAVLPPLLRWLSALLPVTHSANALRLSLLAANVSGSLREMGALALLALVYAVAGLVAVQLALRVGRRNGTLGQY